MFYIVYEIMNSDNLFYTSLLIVGVVSGLQGLFSFLESGANIGVVLQVVGSLLLIVPSGYLLVRGSTTEQIPSLLAWVVFFGAVLSLGSVLISIL